MHKRAAVLAFDQLAAALDRMPRLLPAEDNQESGEIARLMAIAYRGYDSRLRGQQHEMLRALELPKALAEGRLRLFRQPIVATRPSARPSTRCEILLRVVDEAGDLSSPGPRIVAAEHYGLMGAIDRWVIETVLAGFSTITGAASTDSACEVSINLSVNSLHDASFSSFVLAQLDAHGIEPSAICFEITETAAITRMNRAYRTISRLRQEGCRFALDDVGSGFASFAYLKAIPLDYLKIDGSFVRGMTDNPVDRVMVEALNRIGHTIGMRTVAESVESLEAFTLLRQLEVDLVQGYALGRPEPVDGVTNAA